jgi:AcrR family transcriptional regulator
LARPQAPDYADRREAMLGSAAALYATHGFLGASISDLAQACGVSKSLLYHYFGSKEDILFEIMRDHVEALKQMVGDVLKDAPPAPAARLARLTRGFLALYVGASDRHKVLVNDLDKLPATRRRKVVRIERELIDLVADLLAELGPRYGTSRAERRASTMLYFGMINWTHTWFEPDGAVKAPELADRATAIFLGRDTLAEGAA